MLVKYTVSCIKMPFDAIGERSRAKYFFVLLFCLTCLHLKAQQQHTNPITQEQLEDQANANEGETEDDSYSQQMQEWKKHPLNLNIADESDLKAFLFIRPLQIQSFVLYKVLLGKFIDIYELQAIPMWDLETIQRIRPFVYVGNATTLQEDFKQRISKGQYSILIRASQVLEKSRGFIMVDSTGSKYLGSQQHIMFRYKYQYKNLLQFGVVGDKDAGEQLFKGRQKQGFDFYSFHLFARNIGWIKQLAIGDFTVNLGQGLISWQTLAFHKSADAMNIKRQADVLKPYNSPGEFYFHRGIGITVQNAKWQATLFASYKKISANAASDSLYYEDYISSILSSGYHRTITELADKNTISQFAFGGNLAYNDRRLHIGFNGIHYQLSKALQKNPAAYNMFNFSGKRLSNASVDYSYTYRNMHFFGEVASDDKGNVAMVHGLLASLDRTIDASLLYRNIARNYASLYANAFTESTLPINENGLYMGISIRPKPTLRLDAYADVFSFPWLKYLTDRPSVGSEYFVQLNWQPNKQIQVYTRYRNESKSSNLSGTDLPAHLTMNRPKQGWRTHVAYQLSNEITFNGRVEALWFDKNSATPETGFLTFAELGYNPKTKHYGGNFRLQYFESDSYNSRLYAYESDVLYSYSIPPSFNKGYRFYINLNADISKKMTVWFRFSQSVFPGQTSIGSGYDQINKNHHSEIKVQAIWYF